VAGTKTLLEDGITKACKGVTNPDELLRVIEIVADETFPCPKCGSMVNREFKSCPFCAFTLRNTCQACGQDLNSEWTLCPYCSAPSGIRKEAVGDTVDSESGPLLLSPSSVDRDAQKNRGSLPAASAPESKHPNIVVADDDENILKVVTAALRQLPIEVEIFTAADGMQALETIEAKGADLVILDLKMPGMDGFGVCEQLRKDIRTAFLPVLMLTANSDQENRTKGYLIGTDDFMSKPFVVLEFLARVTRLLRRTYGV
jgi:CheY-like chemotaxis protein